MLNNFIQAEAGLLLSALYVAEVNITNRRFDSLLLTRWQHCLHYSGENYFTKNS